MLKRAMFANEVENRRIECGLCPHRCKIASGARGKCGPRLNKGGTLYTEAYGETVSLSVDPIEKKPLYHFYPGSEILSTGPNGCNFSCKFCQNWQISMKKQPTRSLAPTELVDIAHSMDADMIAHTYTEPTIWFEFALDASKLAHERGIKNVFVTNGFIETEPLELILPYLDAMNIDLKSMDDEFYRKQCFGRLEPVLDAIRRAHGQTHIEITNLIITDLNDSDDHIKRLCDFIASVDVDIPLHLSRYFPVYKMEKPPTSPSTLKRAYEIASDRLSYVYLGNIQSDAGRDTHCPNCGNLIISRESYSANIVGLDDHSCDKCGHQINIVR